MNIRNLIHGLIFAPTSQGTSDLFQCFSRSLFVSFTCIAPLAAHAGSNGTQCSAGSPNCLDLYQSTLSAIQKYGFQPPNAGTVTNQSAKSLWSINSFTGGLLTSSPVTYTIPTGQGQPVSSSFYNQYLINCTDPNSLSTTFSIPVTVTNTTTITSSKETTNTHEKSLGGETSVTISYSPPSETGGAGASGTQTFTYGTTDSHSETSTLTNQTSTGIQTGSTITANVTVPYQTSVLIYGQDTVTQYSSIPWQSNVALTGTIGTAIYIERWANTIAPDIVTDSINGSGIPANIWYPGKIWYSKNSDILASPAGTYAFFPNWTAYLVGVYFDNINSGAIDYYQGGWYGTTNQGMNLRLDAGPCTGACAGNFWATNSAGNTVAWDSNTSPAYLAMQDDGNLVGYDNNNKQIWSSNTARGKTSNPTQAFNGLTPQQLLGPSQLDFVATGTYSATTYGSTAVLYVYPPQPYDCSANPPPPPPPPTRSAVSRRSTLVVGKLHVMGTGTRPTLIPGPATPPTTSQATAVPLVAVPVK